MKIFKKTARILLISGILFSMVACTNNINADKSQNTQLPVNANQDEVKSKLLKLEKRIADINAIITEKDKQIQKLNDRIVAIENKENQLEDSNNTSSEQLVIESIKVQFKEDNMMISFEVTNTKPYPNNGSDNYMFEVISEDSKSKLLRIYKPNHQEEILQKGSAKFILTMPSLHDDMVDVVMYELTTGRIARFNCDLIGKDV